MTAKARLYWPILAAWLALDLLTKRLALAFLPPPGVPRELLGDSVRLTLSFNQGGAMGMSLGSWSRPFFTAVGVGVLAFLVHLYRATAPADRSRAAVLAFVTAGALGNLFDRVRWPGGVVDFVDLGIGRVRFWTFNVADMGITLGALALVILLGRREDPQAAPGARPVR